MENPRPGNPYKGLFPYEESHSNRFFGREPEKRKLLRLVNNNFVTVVFGKSGIGKTSLLQAGLYPLLREKGKDFARHVILVTVKHATDFHSLQISRINENICGKIEIQ